MEDFVSILVTIYCLVGMSCVLSGCGDSPKRTKTVLMMRHCVRGTDEKGIYDIPGFMFYNNYSKDPWPEFNPPGMFCQSHGKTILQQSGAWFKEHGSLPAPLHVVADNSTRDITTTQQFLLGFGMDSNSYSISSGPFNSDPSLLPKNCKVTDGKRRNATKKQMKRFPPPEPTFTQILQSVANVTGVGAAGEWAASSFKNLSCFLEEDLSQHWWAPVNGGCYALNSFVERFLMEWGANLTVGWNRMRTDDIPKMLQVHAWYLTVALNVPEIVRDEHASIGWAILDFLEGDEQGTKVFVGHDTEQGALNSALGLSWDPSPFPHNATLPGSVLRFDLDGNDDTVRVSYVFVENFTDGGSMRSVPGSFPDAPVSSISLTKFRGLVENGFNKACRTDNLMRAAVEDPLEQIK